MSNVALEVRFLASSHDGAATLSERLILLGYLVDITPGWRVVALGPDLDLGVLEQEVTHGLDVRMEA